MLIKTIGKSVWVKISTITIKDEAMWAWAEKVGKAQRRGWIRLSREQWPRRPGVRKLELSK